MRTSLFLCLISLLPAVMRAQDGPRLHNFDLGVGGVFPIGGYIANSFHAGPAGRLGYELRPSRYFGVETGFTGAGLPYLTGCKFGCEYTRETEIFFDGGIRGHLPLAHGRFDLSVGVGGGYVWFEHYSS